MKTIYFLMAILFVLVFQIVDAQEQVAFKKNEVGFNILNYSSIDIPSDPP